MPKFIKNQLWVLLLPLCFVANAQFNTPPRDMTATPVAFEPLRQADIAFQWTVERIIDTREKQNLALNWPQNPLRNIMYNSVLTGQVPAYRNNQFTEAIPDTAIVHIGEYCYNVEIPCSDDYESVCDTFICDPLDIEKAVKWKVVEQWYFDSEQSRMIPRIIGLALMYRPIVGGLELPETPVFWVKYDDLRPALAQNQILNPHNEAASISFDHFFNARLFSSYIVKYPNVYDLPIGAMEEFADNNTAALLQAEKMKQKLFETEHDLWEF